VNARKYCVNKKGFTGGITVEQGRKEIAEKLARQNKGKGKAVEPEKVYY
jgi:hypothetical protein